MRRSLDLDSWAGDSADEHPGTRSQTRLDAEMELVCRWIPQEQWPSRGTTWREWGALVAAARGERDRIAGAPGRGGHATARDNTKRRRRDHAKILEHVKELHRLHPAWPWPVVRLRAHDDLTAPGVSMLASEKTIDRATRCLIDRASWGKG